MKQAVVFLRGVKVGILTEDENGYTFEYNADYLTSADAFKAIIAEKLNLLA